MRERLLSSFMKYPATVFLLGLLTVTVSSQSSKPQTATKKDKPSSQSSKPQTTSKKDKPKAPTTKTVRTPPKKSDETSEWEKAVATVDVTQRIAELRKFVETFPNSKKKTDAAGMIVTMAAELGNQKLLAGDLSGAAEMFKTAARNAPKPIPDTVFADTLSKFAANLYFRGMRDEAFEIAKTLEEKAASNVSQLLNIAGFYMSVENGLEAKRVAENAIKLAPDSSHAYQTLGLANRIDFRLDESAAAYGKALDLEPESHSARRGLAEMKRSLGRADEAAGLYREILAKDPSNLPARTGLILALFDGGKREEAEGEMAKSLEANPGNVILLASAAYWYAVNNEGDRAVDLAQKAIAADPRFIWSHVALARGYLSRRDPVAAEKTLLAARRYGNFPTLEYEIASARVAAGYYREAAEELAKSFTVVDGVVNAYLGGRVARESKYFTELVGFERRASIFAPTAADSPENASRLMALLELKQEIDSTWPRPEVAARAADDFVKGDDKMKVHRQVFAATQLLEKKVALPKVVELSKSATANVDAGLDVSTPSIAVMASELYESRSIAAARGEYINVPDVPRGTLSAVIRGRIESLGGWAAFQMDDPGEAVLRLKRSVTVLPVDSAWWRTSTWRLGAALARSGADGDALDMYIKSYKSSGPNAIRYGIIEALYKRVNGSIDGLESKIGPNPSPAPAETTVARATEPPIADVKPEPTPVRIVRDQPARESIPAIVPVATSTPIAEEPKADSTPLPTPEEIKPALSETLPKPTPASTPAIVPVNTPNVVSEDIKGESSVTSQKEIKPVAVSEVSPNPTPQSTPESPQVLDEKPKENIVETKTASPAKELFPPVVITIPVPETGKPEPRDARRVDEPAPNEIKTTEDARPTPNPSKVTKLGAAAVPFDARPRIVEGKSEPAAEIEPCRINVSEENITLQAGGGDLAVIVGLENDGDLEGLTAVSTSPRDVSVRREVIAGVKARALFVLRATSAKAGIYQVRFVMPCGRREIVVRVR